jgi:hypothetical protein
MMVDGRNLFWYEKALRTAKSNFARSKAPESLKELVNNITPIFGFNKKKFQWWALAYCKTKIDNDLYLNRCLRETGEVPHLYISKRRRLYSVIVINGIMDKIDYSFLKEIVFHEFAHIVDFHIRGSIHENNNYGVTIGEEHDMNWSKLSRWMGASGRINYHESEKKEKSFGVVNSHISNTCWKDY